MASLWDDENLYVAFWVRSPTSRPGCAERDSLVWTENDVEIFIGGEDCYYEFEINALGTIYEVFYIWQDALQEGEPLRPAGVRPARARRVDVLGGFQDGMRYGKHPTGPAMGFHGLGLPGPAGGGPGPGDAQRRLRCRRGLDGRDRLSLERHEASGRGRPVPPRDGDVWRMDFSRFELLRILRRDGRAASGLVPQQARRLRLPHPRVLHAGPFLRPRRGRGFRSRENGQVSAKGLADRPRRKDLDNAFRVAKTSAGTKTKSRVRLECARLAEMRR